MDNPNSISVISVIFPLEENTDIMGIMKKIKSALSDMPTLKLDARVVMVKDETDGMGRQSDVPASPVDGG